MFAKSAPFVCGVLTVASLFFASGCGGGGGSSAPPIINPNYSYRSLGLGIDIRKSIAPSSEWDLLRSGGYKLVRFNMHWYSIEKTPGVFNFKQNGQDYDALVSAMSSRGIRVSFHLAYENSNYDNGFAPYTAAGRAAFARFAGACAARYKGKGILWEIWNEPNIDQFWKQSPAASEPPSELYAQLADEAVKAIKRSDPNAYVLGPSIGPLTDNDTVDFIEALGKKGTLALLDGVSVHPYQSERPEMALVHYDAIRSAVARYVPGGKPLYNTETGRSTGQYAGLSQLSEEEQAAWLVRSYLVDLMAGLDSTVWYNWSESGSSPTDVQQNFGVVTQSLQPKPAYNAAKAALAFLDGFTLSQTIEAGATGTYVLLFAKGVDSRAVLWRSLSGRDVASVTLPVGQWSAFDTYGRAVGTYTSTGSPVQLELNGSPLFLRLAK